MGLSVLSTIRLENKIYENRKKLYSNLADVLNTVDYNFSKKHGIDRVGDSGELLLAYKRENRKERYIVKHYYGDCACNEYVYSKLAYAMDIKTPSVKLFNLSQGEKRRYFNTEYIGAIELLDIKKEGVSFEPLSQEQVINWQDHLRFKTLYHLFSESDSFEVIQTTEDYIYKIDNSASFMISAIAENVGLIESLGKTSYDDFLLELWNKDVNTNVDELKRVVSQVFLNKLTHLKSSDSSVIFGLRFGLESVKKNYGIDFIRYYLEPLERIQDIPESYIDDFLNTLCYIYPDSLGNYYKEYIEICKVQASQFLKVN